MIVCFIYLFKLVYFVLVIELAQPELVDLSKDLFNQVFIKTIGCIYQNANTITTQIICIGNYKGKEI